MPLKHSIKIGKGKKAKKQKSFKGAVKSAGRQGYQKPQGLCGHHRKKHGDETRTQEEEPQKIEEHELIQLNVNDIKFDDTNPNQMSQEQMSGLRKAMERFGYLTPIIIDQNNLIADGEHRLLVYKEFGRTQIPAYRLTFTDDSERRLLRQTMNKLRGQHDLVMDAKELEILRKANKLPDLASLIAEDEVMFKRIIGQFNPDADVTGIAYEHPDGTGHGNLAARWGMPPFSVLDRRTATWRSRRQQWLDLGIALNLGREKMITIDSSASAGFLPIKDGKVDDSQRFTVSVFDPVLTEIMIRWFCIPKQAKILDPFCGGSVRGVVASYLGHQYTGFDLRQEQIDANYKQYDFIQRRLPAAHKRPEWIRGDSKDMDTMLDGQQFDFCLTCPPYFNLEKYSSLEQDLSNMTWEQFRETYRTIIQKTAQHLKPNSFSCWVISNVRDTKTRTYLNLQDLTKQLFEDAGFNLYNELVLIHPIYSLIFRAGRQFETKRTIGKSHEFVLVFYNGKYEDIPPVDPQQIDLTVPEETLVNPDPQTPPDQNLLD